MSLPIAILAGGMATRLRPLTERIPKALIEVAGRPFIEHQLDLLRRSGFTRVVLCLGYLGERVEALLGDASRWGMDLVYVYDGAKLLGTGGALCNALHLLGKEFLVLYGDSYLDCDYAAIQKAFLTSGKLALMTVFKNDNRWDKSNVLLKDGRILRYDKHRPTADMKHIDYGLGAFRKEVFAGTPQGTMLDLTTVYQHLISRDELALFEAGMRFYEIGTPEGLEETRRYFLKRRPMG